MTPEENAENAVISALAVDLMRACDNRPTDVAASALVTALGFVLATYATDIEVTMQEINASLRAAVATFVTAKASKPKRAAK
jgi:type IV secretory pathway protease TraF